jgi:hypothetical protein
MGAQARRAQRQQQRRSQASITDPDKRDGDGGPLQLRRRIANG